MQPCDTADCDNLVTRSVTWEWPSTGGGEYCDDCARRLWEGGDRVDPPFPLASVTRLPGQENPE